jgi:hypothetical protein
MPTAIAMANHDGEPRWRTTIANHDGEPRWRKRWRTAPGTSCNDTYFKLIGVLVLVGVFREQFAFSSPTRAGSATSVVVSMDGCPMNAFIGQDAANKRRIGARTRPLAIIFRYLVLYDCSEATRMSPRFCTAIASNAALAPRSVVKYAIPLVKAARRSDTESSIACRPSVVLITN